MTGTRSPLTLPKWGMNMVEATLTAWLKSVGDHVVEGEEIAEIATDKVDTALESPVTGTIVEIVVDEGEDAEVGDVLAYIEADA
jgi:pyruvate/2-oxoglutarate dehydrogenase complex dihydrolipoamide acyltransferase (E2) component